MSEITENTKPKLSALMRQGAALTKKAIGKEYWATANGYGERVELTCAIGAAAFAVDPDRYRGAPERKLWESTIFLEKITGVNVSEVRAQHPLIVEPAMGMGTLWSIITDLNDSEKWSREEIADWLEGIGY